MKLNIWTTVFIGIYMNQIFIVQLTKYSNMVREMNCKTKYI